MESAASGHVLQKRNGHLGPVQQNAMESISCQLLHNSNGITSIT